MELAEKFKFIRESFKINQKEFADKLNTNQSKISKIESGNSSPDFEICEQLFNEFGVNPNWIFKDKKPYFLEVEDDQNNDQNIELLKDLRLILSSEELNSELNSILLDNVLNKIVDEDPGNKSSFQKFFKAIKLQTHIPFRPLLFIYYVFRYIRDHKEELNNVDNFQEYFLGLVNRYEVLSFKNNPIFTTKIKSLFDATISMNLTEEDCKVLVLNYDKVIEKIESRMPKIVVYSHKEIDTKSLFPISQ